MAIAGLGNWSATAAKAAVIPSFPELLRSNQNMVFSIAVHYLRDRAVAEEIAQDVFLELHRHLSEIESEAHAVFWLRRVTSRKCIDAIRRQKLRATLALEKVPEPASADQPSDPLLRRKLTQLIESLPEKARMMMVLRYQEEMMPEEIAEVLEVPVRSVKAQLHRSLTVLREKFSRLKGGSHRG